MPAIDPERLRRQVDAVAARFPDPHALRRELVDVLEFYADRSRKSMGSMRASNVLRSYRPPRPVMRALEAALAPRAAAHPGPAAEVARELWRTGYREPRLLAIELMAVGRSGPALERIEAWAGEAEDDLVLQALAARGLQAWRAHDPDGFLEGLGAWLRRPEPRMRVFAMTAVQAAIEDEGFQRLPPLVDLLDRAQSPMSPPEGRAFLRTHQALVARSPAEAAHAVLARLARDPAGARSLARSLLPSFPEQYRSEIREALLT